MTQKYKKLAPGKAKDQTFWGHFATPTADKIGCQVSEQRCGLGSTLLIVANCCSTSGEFPYLLGDMSSISRHSLFIQLQFKQLYSQSLLQPKCRETSKSLVDG